MYSQRISDQAILQRFHALNREPKRHTRAQIDAAITHFNSLVEITLRRDASRFPLIIQRKRAFTPDELAFIENERLLCRLDFRYWLSNYAWVKSWRASEAMIRVEPNIAQQVTMDIWGDLEAMGVSIEILQLKARQLGMSTLTELAVQHRAQFYSYINAVVASSSPGQSEKMGDMMVRCLQRQPWFLLPTCTAFRERTLIEFGRFNSGISIQHGSQFTGIGRGTTPSMVHLCLAPSTQLELADGDQTPISAIRMGTSIRTHTGAWGEVTAISRRPEARPMLRLRAWMEASPLDLTEDHQVWAKPSFQAAPGKIPANRLTTKSWIGTPIKSFTPPRLFSLALPGRISHTGVEPIQGSIPLTKEFGYFVGYYLAEGSLGQSHGHATQICLSHHRDRAATAQRAVQAVLPFISSHSTRDHSLSSHTLLYGSSLARLVQSEFGLINSKTIPEWVFTAPPEFAEGLLIGYLSGDGSRGPSITHQGYSCPTIYATSAHPRILRQIRYILAALGIGWGGITYADGFTDSRGWKVQPQATLTINGMAAIHVRRLMGRDTPPSTPARLRAQRYHLDLANRMVWCRIRAITHIPTTEFTYDIEIAHPDHTFVTLAGAVSNSEVAAFQRPEQIIDAALLRAVHPAPGVFMVFESTAEGRGNWLHFNWLQSVQGYHTSEARLFPMFLPWYVGSDKYPSPEWLHKRPVPPSWEPNSLTQLHAESARRYVASDPVLSRYMPAGWAMPLAQMWFYQCEYNEYKAKRELAVFKQEMPATPDEAFQSTGFSAFDAELVTEYSGMAKPPIGIYGLVARPDLIALNLQPYRNEVDPNRPPIEIVPATRQGIEQDIRVKLVPLRATGSLQLIDPNNKVFIWEMPDPTASYGAGEDLAEGLGEDRSVIEIIRKGDFDHPIRQVCEFASDEVNAVGATAIAYALGSFYSPRFPTPGLDPASTLPESSRQLRHIIEVNTGEPLQLELRKLGWSNFHRWCRYDSRKLVPTNKLGWFTVTWSRWLMLDYLIHFLRNHLIDIGSPWFIDEMQSFQKADSDAKLKAEFGAHDDRIMAFGIAFFSLHIWDYVFKMGVVGSRDSQFDDLYVPVGGSPFSLTPSSPLPVYQPPFSTIGRPIGSRPTPLPLGIPDRYPSQGSFPGSYQGYAATLVGGPGFYEDDDYDY